MGVIANAYHIAIHQLLDVNYRCSSGCGYHHNKMSIYVYLKLVTVIFFKFVWNIAKS